VITYIQEKALRVALAFFKVPVTFIRGKKWQTVDPQFFKSRVKSTPFVPLKTFKNLPHEGLTIFLVFVLVIHTFKN